MKGMNYCAAVILGLLAGPSSDWAGLPNPITLPASPDQMAGLRLPLIANAGQIADPQTCFYANTLAGSVYLTRAGELIYALPRYEATAPAASPAQRRCAALSLLRESLLDAGPTRPVGKHPAVAKANFFIGNDPAHWRTGVAAYDTVDYPEIYPGITLSVQARGYTLEKVFTIQPGGDPQDIRVSLSGADSLRVDPQGRLVVGTPNGDIRFSAPVAYQERINGREPVAIQYWVEGLSYSFEVADYDTTRALIIDPLLAGTYLGGQAWDDALALAVDNQGRVYVTGFSTSTDFPSTAGAYQTNNLGGNVFIAMLDNRMTNLLAATFIGGTVNESAYAILPDNAGRVYLIGTTSSSNYPTTAGAYQRIYQDASDTFVSILDSSLSSLLASTLLGGTDAEFANTLAVNGAGEVFVAGATRSTNFPTTAGAFSRTLRGWGDGYIAKFAGDLSTLLASTYLGGSNFDEVMDLKLDAAEDLYLTGITGGNGFPTTNTPYCSVYQGGEFDGFAAKMDKNLTTLHFSTYIGGTNDDRAEALALGGSAIYIAGYTYSSNFPVTGSAYLSHFQGGTNDAFVAKFDLPLQQLYAATFLGGTEFDFATALKLDAAGSVWVAGYTESPNFPTTAGAYTNVCQSTDGFIAQLDGSLRYLGAATFLGGRYSDYIYGLDLDAAGNVYVAGYTESDDFPTAPGAYSRFYHTPTIPWYGDAFAAKMDASLSARPAPPIRVSASSGTYPDRISLAWLASDRTTGYTVWRSLQNNPGFAASIANLDAAAASYVDRGIEPGTTYYYWLTATNAFGRSEFSDSTAGRRSLVCALAADFDGDGRADPTIVTNGAWFIWMSANSYQPLFLWPFADASNLTAAADFDGDRRGDPALIHYGAWYVWFSGNGYTMSGPFTLSPIGASVAPADFDGDLKADPTMEIAGLWFFWFSSYGYQMSNPYAFGDDTLFPVGGDLDGDGIGDMAMVSVPDGIWRVKMSGLGYQEAGPYLFYQPQGLPAAGDFDGDGKADPAVYRQDAGDWYVWFSSAGYAPGGPFTFHP